MPGKAWVDARILRLGKSAAFMEAECFDPDGKLVAKATATAIPMPFKRLG
jgi:acyl-coenzyme A thioesterase PaaI-like protein